MAAQGYIVLTGSESRLSWQVRLIVDAIKTLREQGPDVKEALAQAANPDNASLAAAMGFPANQQGADNAGAVKDMVSSAVADIVGLASATAVIQRLT